MNEPEHSQTEEVKSAEELGKRIGVLERKIIREKRARGIAEHQLEQYSLEIYEANQSLVSALASATQKQLELEFLGRASSDVASELPLNEMIYNLVELTGKFCSADYAVFLIYENGEPVEGKLNEFWSIQSGWQATQCDIRAWLESAALPLTEGTLLDSWMKSEATLTVLDTGDLVKSLFYTNFALAGAKVGWMIFFRKTECIGEDMLSVLRTARVHLTSGIRRRLSDLRILKRNQQLQDSLDKLEKARRQLIQSEKMASLGQLAAGVAHEINNPVAFIRSNMEVLKEYLNDYKALHEDLKAEVLDNGVLAPDVFKAICQKVDLDYIDEDSKELLASNIDGLDRVKEIVDNLKGFSHAGDEELVKMSLFKCVDSALKIAGNAFKYEHKVNNQLSEACPSIIGNSGQLQQVFVNLFVNAAYAMESGGELTVCSSEVNDRVLVHVKDTGCGMDLETVNQLFTPFFTTKPVGIGTGLGLSVSYAILEAHEAQVTVDSEVGVGTTFNLSFAIAVQ